MDEEKSKKSKSKVEIAINQADAGSRALALSNLEIAKAIKIETKQSKKLAKQFKKLVEMIEEEFKK